MNLRTSSLGLAALTGSALWLSVGLAHAQSSDLDSLIASINPFDVTSLAIPGRVDVDLRNERLANSELDEFSPTLYGDAVVFASARKPPEFLRVLIDEDHEKNFTSLFRAPIDDQTGELVGVATFGGKLNHIFHDAAPTFTAGGDTVYFTRSHSKGRRRLEGADGYMYLSIYTSHKEGDSWSEPELLPFSSRDSDEMHPALSPDGRRMYFASTRPGGFGETDIWVAQLADDGTWTKPVNLGPQVNRPDREAFPFVGADGTLHFASDMPGGFGKFDLYRAVPNGRGGYELPENLGEPYNSAADDTGYISPDGGLTGYFSSSREGGLGGDDLYGFTQSTAPATAPSGVLVAHLEGRPDSTIEGVAVTLYATGEPIIPRDDTLAPGAMQVVTLASGQVGVELSRGLEYDFAAAMPGFEAATGSLRFDPETLKASVALIAKPAEVDTVDTSLDVEEKKLRPGLVIELANILYDFDDASIRADARDDLDTLAALMQRYPSLEIELRAHTDQHGPVSYNRDLSARRAASAKEYLVSAGIAGGRLSGVGLGESSPRIDCGGDRPCTRDQHQLNRRTEFRVLRFEPLAREVEIRGVVSSEDPVDQLAPASVVNPTEPAVREAVNEVAADEQLDANAPGSLEAALDSPMPSGTEHATVAEIPLVQTLTSVATPQSPAVDSSARAAEPAIEVEQVLPVEPAIAAEPVVESEPAVEAAPVVEAVPVVEFEHDIAAQPALDVEQVLEVEPATGAEPVLKAEPAVDTLQAVETLQAVAAEPASDVQQVLEVEPAGEVEPVLEGESAIDAPRVLEAEPATDTEQVLEVEPIVQMTQISEVTDSLEGSQLTDPSGSEDAADVVRVVEEGVGPQTTELPDSLQPVEPILVIQPDDSDEER